MKKKLIVLGMFCTGLANAQEGNVGIGIENPTERLDVNGDTRVRGLSGTEVGVVFADKDGKLVRSDESDLIVNINDDLVCNSTTLGVKWGISEGVLECAYDTSKIDQKRGPYFLTYTGRIYFRVKYDDRYFFSTNDNDLYIWRVNDKDFYVETDPHYTINKDEARIKMRLDGTSETRIIYVTSKLEDQREYIVPMTWYHKITKSN